MTCERNESERTRNEQVSQASKQPCLEALCRPPIRKKKQRTHRVHEGRTQLQLRSSTPPPPLRSGFQASTALGREFDEPEDELHPSGLRERRTLRFPEGEKIKDEGRSGDQLDAFPSRVPQQFEDSNEERNSPSASSTLNRRYLQPPL